MPTPVTGRPADVECVANLMASFPHAWFLCGGWAVDAWLGRQTRDHHDVDIAVFHDDQRALFDHLAGWQLVGHDANVADDTTEPWDGRSLDLPAPIHARPGGSTPAAAETGLGPGFNLEILLNERSAGDWVFRSAPRITLPLARCSRESPWGLPTAAPEVILFYKATAYYGEEAIAKLAVKDRPHDEADFLALLPQLDQEAKEWLREATSFAQPGHPWLTRLTA